MARNTNIKLRRSATQSAIPTTSNLDLGEIAINTYDGKLYAKTTEGSTSEVVQVGSATDTYHKIRKGTTQTLTVKVISKTSNHPWHGSGSSSGYQIDGIESPHFHLVPGNTYRFDQSDSSNSGHPLRFYYEADKTTNYTTGVTTNGTPGSSGAYTQIVPTDTTPVVLHYQCSAHAYMGGRVDFGTRNLTGFDTDDLGEGSSNLYFTNARARAAVSASGDLSYNSSTGVFSFSHPTMYADSDARGAISVTDSGGDGSLSYNSSTGVITYTGPSASEVRAHISAGTGVSISSGQISIGQAVATNSNVSFGNISTVGNVTTTGNVVVGGNLTVNGTTTTVNSTTTTVDDPVFTLGGDTAPSSDDNKDRGIEFNYHTGSAAKVGFFGYDDSAGKFTFIADATNSSEVFSGSPGDVVFGGLVASGLTYPTSDGSNGQALVTDGSGNLSFSSISAGGNAFGTIAVSGQSNVVADSNSDTLTLVAGSNITLTTDASGDSVTIASSGSGSVSEAFKTISVSGQSDVVADSATDTLTLVAGSGMTLTTDASADSITFVSSGGGSSQSAIYKEYLYVATSGQTTFSGSDANSATLSYNTTFISVFLNGVRLRPSTDFTATNGTSVVLVNGASTGDILQIETFVQVLGFGDSTVSTFTGNGSTSAFTLGANPNNENNTQVYVDGVYQAKDKYSVSGTTLTFGSGNTPPSGASIEVVIGSRNVTIDDAQDLTVKGALSVEGNTTLGNASSDTITVTGTPTFAETATFTGAIDANSTVNVSGTLSLDGTANELRFYEGSNYVGFEAPSLSGDQIWVLPSSDGSSGQALKTDGSGNLSWGTAGDNAFATIAVSGQSNVVADSTSDTLTLVAGTGITLTTDASADSVTITNSSTGGNSFGNIAVSGQTTVAADQATDTLTLAGSDGITITTTAGTDTVTIAGTSSVNPFSTDLFTTANSSTTAFTLSSAPSSEDNLIVFVEGVYQNKNSYSLSGTTLTLDSAPASGTEVVVHIVGNGITGSNMTVDEFTGDGSTTDFTMSLNPISENNTFVYLDGVYQEKSVYSVSGTTLTFATAPVSGHSIEVITPTTTQINQPAANSINAIGMFDDDSIMGSEVTSTTMTTTSATTIASHAVATFRTIKYLVSMKQGTDYHATEVNLLHDGTTVYITEYGTLFDNAALGTLSATISGGNILLQLTPGSNSSLTARVVSTAIRV